MANDLVNRVVSDLEANVSNEALQFVRIFDNDENIQSKLGALRFDVDIANQTFLEAARNYVFTVMPCVAIAFADKEPILTIEGESFAALYYSLAPQVVTPLRFCATRLDSPRDA